MGLFRRKSNNDNKAGKKAIQPLSMQEQLNVMRKLDEIAGGGVAPISKAEIVFTQMNMMDAKKSLLPEQLNAVRDKFAEYTHMRTTRVMDTNTLQEVCGEIFRDFNAVAPIDSYVSSELPQIAFVKAEVTGDNREMRKALEAQLGIHITD